MYQIPKLREIKSINHAFSTVNDGNMSFVYGSLEATVKNREKFLQKIGIDINNCISSYIEHGTGVVLVDKKHLGVGMMDSKEEVRCDAMLTNEKNVFLFLKTADCAPVILYDGTKKVLGLIHIGWKNVENEIMKKVVKICKTRYKIDSKNLQIYIGPYVHKNSYIKENPSQLKDSKWKNYLSEVNLNTYKIDFIGLFKAQLMGLGVKKSNIFDCNIDTARDHRFYSHLISIKENGANEGRFACVVGMK
jgi:polyphenol oxidase